ncbi:MAG TPA: insulinase family protein, partial [Bacteroidetes bacterium]|nr:insulinase family protein [Bacteroidota bacterium]
LEHLLFNGTVNRTQEEIYAEFDRIGAYCNAHTGSHFVDFMLLVPSADFTTGFEILTDMIFNSDLPPWKFEKERGIVMEEMAQNEAMGRDDDQIFREALFGDAPLSRPVLGSVESIEHMERDSVLAFYRRWYAPNNMLLFVYGSFSADTLFEWLQDRLSVHQPRELPPRRMIAPPDFPGLNSLGIVHRQVERRNRQVFLAFNAPGPGDPEFPAFLLLQTALDRRLEDKLPPGSSGGGRMFNDPDLSVCQVSLSSLSDGPSAAELVASLDKIISDLTVNPPDQAEINRLARNYRAERIFNAEMLNHYGIMYADYWALVSWDEFSSWPDRMARLTPSDLAEVAARWLSGADRFIMTLEPVQKVEETAVDTTRGVERLQVEDGPTILVRSDPSAQVFAMHVLIRNRWLFDREFGTGAVDLLHHLLGEGTRSGGKSLSERLDDLSARLKVADNPGIPFDNYYTTPAYSFVRLEMLPERWREGVELVADLMSGVQFDDTALEKARKQTSAAGMAAGRSAVSVGRQRLRDHLFPGTALSASVYGDVSALSSDDLRRLKKNYFQARNMIISVAGPVAGEAVTEAVRSAFGKLPASGAAPPVYTPFSPTGAVEGETAWRDTVKLGKAQGAVVTGGIIPSVDPLDLPALTVANAYFNKRLAEVLRETLGLAYSLGSSVQSHRSKDGDVWAYREIHISTRRENIARAEQEIGDLIRETFAHHFTEGEVEEMRNAIAGRLMMRSMSRIGQAYAMGIGEFFRGDPDYRTHLIGDLREVTAQQVEDATRKYLGLRGMSTVIVE